MQALTKRMRRAHVFFVFSCGPRDGRHLAFIIIIIARQLACLLTPPYVAMSANHTTIVRGVLDTLLLFCTILLWYAFHFVRMKVTVDWEVITAKKEKEKDDERASQGGSSARK